MCEKHEKVFTALNYFKHFLVFVSAVSGCVSISVCCKLIGTVGLKTCALTAVIKKYQAISKKKKKKHDITMLLVKTELNTIEVLISKA